jgi:DNA polymerase III epsilon subunit-like protein
MNKEIYISVDVETSGPIPGDYSLLSIGACVTESPDITFYREFQPTSDSFVPEALAVSKLKMNELHAKGLTPAQGMKEFQSWIHKNSDGSKPIFVGFNAPFDWSFVNYYFHHYLGENPFGFSALDVKALFMGHSGCSWDATRSSQIAKVLETTFSPNHNALQDALAQADLFEKIRRRFKAPIGS